MTSRDKLPERREERPEDEAQSGQPGGGRGRREEAGGSGVYPASAGEAPEDATVRTPGE